MKPVLNAQLQKVALFGGTFIAGAFFSWVVTKRQYEATVEREIAEAKAFYEKKYNERLDSLVEETKVDTEPVDDAYTKTELLVEALGYADARMPAQHTDYGKLSRPKVAPKDVVIVDVREPANVVRIGTPTVSTGEIDMSLPDEDPEETWDYVYELKNRHREVPYVIHYNEFQTSREGYTQVAYTFYEDDEVMVDDGDMVIHDIYKILGVDTLKFGHGSPDDDTVVYVRNEVLDMEFEVTLVRESYAKSVLGLDPEPELRHSQSRMWRSRAERPPY